MIRPQRLYALGNPADRFMNRLKDLRRVATRYDQTTSSFLAFVLLGCARAWIAHIGPE